MCGRFSRNYMLSEVHIYYSLVSTPDRERRSGALVMKSSPDNRKVATGMVALGC